MTLTHRIEKALAVSLRIHERQKRKDGTTPYAVHPVSVAMLLAQYSDDEDIIIAGLLHDAIEDTDYKGDKIERDFGKHVRSIVEELTEKNPNAPWDERKLNYLVQLKNKSKEACLVTCADKIHNLKSIGYAYAAIGDELWKRFNASKEKKIWFYEQIYKEFKKRFRHGLIRELHHAIKEIKGIKLKEEKRAERSVGPYDIAEWDHFSIEKENGPRLFCTRNTLSDSIGLAERLTRAAKKESVAKAPANSKLTYGDMWNFSKSYGVYDATGRMVYWADWFAV